MNQATKKINIANKFAELFDEKCPIESLLMLTMSNIIELFSLNLAKKVLGDEKPSKLLALSTLIQTLESVIDLIKTATNRDKKEAENDKS